MLSYLTRSLSFRLLAIFLVLGALFAYGAMTAVRWVYSEDELRELISGHLSLHVDYVRRDIGNPPDIGRAVAITEKVPVDIRIVGPDLNWASDTAFPQFEELSFGASRYFSDEPDAWLRQLENVEFAELDGHRFLKLEQGPYSIIVASPKIAVTQSSPDLLAIIVGFGLVLVLLAYLAVRWLFKPVGTIRQGASRIGHGDLDYRITNIRRDELGDLAEDVNNMAAEVQRMLDAKRQLLLGISHELRSPLSRLRLSLEFLNESPDVQQLRDEISEMERIIETLLEAERLNTRHAALKLGPASLPDLAEELIENYFARDRDRIAVTIEGGGEEVMVDEARLILLLKNLLGNALRYSNPGDGPVELAMARHADKLEITVRDHGRGIPPEQVAHIGEPFFRGDPSRTRGTGGSGLGLYLSKLVAEAHGGQLRLREDIRDGACFEVILPIASRIPGVRRTAGA
jgi:signal transduction histidine kinase